MFFENVLYKKVNLNYFQNKKNPEVVHVLSQYQKLV